MYRYRFSDTEINKLLKENLVIIYDTREQRNEHILKVFDEKGIKYKRQKVDEGDYIGIITARPEMGIYRDLYFDVAVERKNSVDELIASIKDADRFEDEFNRALIKGKKIYLLIEDEDGLHNMKTGNYRSQYNPKALMGKFDSLSDKYLKGTIFVNKEDSAEFIYRKLYYSIRNFLKNGKIDLGDEK